jgi:hypothetical protein
VSDNKRSFWSSVPGLVTGLAGLLTGIVGLVTVLIQLNVIGGGSSDKTAVTEPTPSAGVTTTAPTGVGSTATTELGTFVLSPKPLNFGPADPKVKTVTVKNTSDRVAITLKPPLVTGDNAAQFSAVFDTCGSAPLAPNLSCTLKVTFTPSGPLGNYKATLQVKPATGAVAGDEVTLTASTLLGG